MKPFRLYNTLTRDYTEIHTPRVRIYMCGMTVQDSPHMGHVRTFLMGDMLRRALEFLGYEVLYVQNFTDIDDKIIQRARDEQLDWRQIADRYIQEYHQVRARMNFLPPYAEPRAALHIEEILALTRRLLDLGIAYSTPDGVFFSVDKFPSYGKLSGKKLDDLVAGARVEPSPHKRNPLDFALWKARKEGEPYWYAPFGEGRPGWHIECSAMSTHYLGQPFEIHAGGTDLIFPHHENEIAQSEAAHEHPFAQAWFHVEMMQLKGVKMSKSTGLFFRALDVLEQYPAPAVRLYLLQHHYRTPMDYTREGLEGATRAYSRLVRFLQAIPDFEGHHVTLLPDWMARFEEALRDDLNTPQAVGTMFALLNESYSRRQEGASLAREALTLQTMMQTLGITLPQDTGLSRLSEELLELLIHVRGELRKVRAFELADHIRDELGKRGIALEDTPEGTRWTWKQGA